MNEFDALLEELRRRKKKQRILHDLSNIQVDEISLVDRGANGKRFFLLKRLNDMEQDKMTGLQDIGKAVTLFKSQLGSSDPDVRERIEKADRSLYEYIALGLRDNELSPEEVPVIEALIEKRCDDWLAANREFDKSYTPERAKQDVISSTQEGKLLFYEALPAARSPKPVRKADSAMAELSKHAARIQAEEGRGCTPQQAFAEAYARYPDLAARELQERRG